MQEALDEIKLAFENFCADAQAILDEAKERKRGTNGRNESRGKKSGSD